MCEQNQQQSKNNDAIASLFKTYEIFQNIVIQETKEFYEFSEVILMVLVAILGIHHWDTSNFLLILGLAISIIWFAGFVVQIMWKRHWGGRIRNVEDEISKKEIELSKILTEDRDNWVPGLFYRDKDNKKIPLLKFHFNFIFGLFPIVFTLLFYNECLSLKFPFIYFFTGAWQFMTIFAKFMEVIISFMPICLLFLLWWASYKYPNNQKVKLMDTTEKKIALDALFYEVWMLNEAFHLLSLSHLHPTSLVSENANLESFLIHTRNIVYFLEDGQESGDIRCSDFGIAGIKVNLPAGNGIREINKYLSHLTKERISVPKPKWECEKIKEEINGKIEQFITNLDQSIFPTSEGRTTNSFMEILRKI